MTVPFPPDPHRPRPPQERPVHSSLTYADIKTAAERIRGHVRPVTIAHADPGDRPYALHLALELMQHTGSFKARGAQNFLLAHREEGTLPPRASRSPPAATPASPVPGRLSGRASVPRSSCRPPPRR